MTFPPLNFSASTSQRADSGASSSVGYAGGQSFTFGGINTPSPWPWIIGLAVGGLAFYWFFFRRK
jgi:hypothetical protein